MTEGHPIVWAWTVLAVGAVTLVTSNIVGLAALAVCLTAAGLLASGPRRASLSLALGLSLLATAWWALATVALPLGGGQVLAQLPQFLPGAGVRFGGDLTVGDVSSGLTHALRAVVVLLALGVAGQVVSSRGWLALARATVGPATPIVAPLCCLGEACAEGIASQRAARRRGHARVVAGSWLVSLVRADTGLARWGSEQARAAWLLTWRATDLLQVLAPAALTAVLLTHDRAALDLTTDGLLPGVPWWLLGAALLLPAGVLRRA